MLTKSQQSQVIDHLDKARLILQSASEEFEYPLSQMLISKTIHMVKKYQVKDEK